MEVQYGEKVMEVDDEKRAKVDARSDFQKAAAEGDAYIWTRETAAFSALDTLLCVRNDNSAKTLHITKVVVESSHASTEIEIHRITAAYTSAGTTVTGTNLLLGGAAADATGVSDETGNTQGTVMERRILRAYTPLIIDFEGTVELKNAQAIGIDSTLGDDVVYASIWGYFK